MSTEVVAPMKDALAGLAEALQGLDSAYTPPVKHHRVQGLYGREAVAFADSCVVSYVHKVDHFTFVLEGKAYVVDQDGSRNLVEAPAFFVTKAGTQRAIIAITDIRWTTVHPDKGTTDADNDSMEEVMCCKTFEEYENYVAALPSPEEV